jgi:hypothetical protein
MDLRRLSVEWREYNWISQSERASIRGSARLDGDRLQVLMTTYQEVGAHLRATDEKRDTLFNVYVTILVALASGLILLRANFAEMATGVIVLALMLGSVVIALGETVFAAIVSYRKWHAEYMNCMGILQAMLSGRIAGVGRDALPPEEREPFIGGIHTSRLSFLVQIGVLASYLMAANVLADTRIGSWAYALGAGLGAITVLGNARLAQRFLRAAEAAFWREPARSWVFAGFPKQSAAEEVE